MSNPGCDAPEGTILRSLAPGDLNYVLANWLRDLRDADPSVLEDDLWFPAHREHVQRVLSDPATSATVLASADDPNEILGFIVTGGTNTSEVLWWIHVRKGELRGRGLARTMIEATGARNFLMAWSTPAAQARLTNRHRPRRIRAARRAGSSGRRSAT